MYNYYLDQILKAKHREADQRSKTLKRQSEAHKVRTDQLKHKYWSRVENFMYTVNSIGNTEPRAIFHLSEFQVESFL